MVINHLHQLETSRLSLSLMTEDDTPLFYELDQDEAVMKYINGGVKSSHDDIHLRFLPRFRRYNLPEKGFGLWKVTAKPSVFTSEISGQYLGWILVRPMYFYTDNPHHHNIEIGWRLKQSAWGKGVATEAATAVMDFIAQQPEVTMFTAIALEHNLASIAVMKKLTMQFVKKALHTDGPVAQELVFYQKRL
ncbi:GNAT family N-acetyltransferase [Shewanella aestuarii]|uniref:GNAT family N-acetyltransferase n=1 Tax=Shewanella aestuarii TaxID=1028752 RepID=A0A6G9QK99_9GAMM|nr:GNAT family N-acetyltransferase [Shewanella aestuarii]QIR14497.1 GNAT family N-acetyltransferase [Shewanella aestuarii]